MHHDDTYFQQNKQLVFEHLTQLITKYQQCCPPTLNQRIDSAGKQETDPYINVGTGGAVLVYHKIYSFFKDSGQYDGTNKE